MAKQGWIPTLVTRFWSSPCAGDVSVVLVLDDHKPVKHFNRRRFKHEIYLAQVDGLTRGRK